MSATVAPHVLPELPRRVHRALITAVVATGTIPTRAALADKLDVPPDVIHDALQTLAAADYLALDEGGQITCLYPFSPTPSAHAVVISGQRRYAMCSIDALGMPAMLGQELDIEGRCAVCYAQISLHIRPGTVGAATPAEAMVVARRDEAEPAFAACCPFTVFACGQAHAEQFMRRIPGSSALSFAAALIEAEKIFAGLLDETLPARRPRGRRWESSRDA